MKLNRYDEWTSREDSWFVSVKKLANSPSHCTHAFLSVIFRVADDGFHIYKRAVTKTVQQPHAYTHSLCISYSLFPDKSLTCLLQGKDCLPSLPKMFFLPCHICYLISQYNLHVQKPRKRLVSWSHSSCMSSVSTVLRIRLAISHRPNQRT